MRCGGNAAIDAAFGALRYKLKKLGME